MCSVVRAGENIGYEVIDVCCGVNSRLKVFRAHFSGLIPAYVPLHCFDISLLFGLTKVNNLP